jgi:hypothetical protein
VSQFTGREARLKPEFAHVYPPLEAGKWEPAGVLADKVTAWLLRQAHGGDGPARIRIGAFYASLDYMNELVRGPGVRREEARPGPAVSHHTAIPGPGA